MTSKILLVDDDPDMMQISTTILKAEGYEIERAQNGEEAMEKLKDFRPSIIVTDIMMPGMGGWKFCQKMKENPSLKNIPILAITGRDRDIDELMTYESGADEFLVKPFNNEDFLSAIKRLIEKGVC